jgi:hypothetical protein
MGGRWGQGQVSESGERQRRGEMNRAGVMGLGSLSASSHRGLQMVGRMPRFMSRAPLLEQLGRIRSSLCGGNGARPSWRGRDVCQCHPPLPTYGSHSDPSAHRILIPPSLDRSGAMQYFLYLLYLTRKKNMIYANLWDAVMTGTPNILQCDLTCDLAHVRRPTSFAEHPAIGTTSTPMG